VARPKGKTKRFPGGTPLILRIDRIQTELPPPSDPDPAGAAVVQELMGGKFGEMSTLVYTPEHKIT
jgi:Manganese containing catalase